MRRTRTTFYEELLKNGGDSDAVVHLAEKQFREEISHLQQKVQALKQDARHVEKEIETDLEKYNELISEAKKSREETRRKKEDSF